MSEDEAGPEAEMKDVTSTSFGLLIAFLLPGFSGFYALGFYSGHVRDILAKFREAESNLGWFLVVLLMSLTAGLLLTLARWLIFEQGFCRHQRLPAERMANLRFPAKFVAYRAAVDETYRYHQFFGGMAIVIPFAYIGWLREAWPGLTRFSLSLTLVLFLLIEALTAYGAAYAYRNFTAWAGSILGGS